MRFPILGAALAAVAFLCAAPASAADNYPVRDGTGTTQTFCSKYASAIQHPCHLLELLFSGVPAAVSGGQQPKSLSLPVVLPSDPDTRNSSANITAADAATSTVAGQSGVTLITGTPTANASVTWQLNGHSSLTIQASGTFSLTAPIETSADCALYAPATSKILGAGATAGTITAPGVFRVDVTGMACARVRATAFTSGSMALVANASSASGLTQILNPVRLSDASGNVVGVSGNPLYEAAIDGANATLGAQADAACGTDNGTCTTQAVLKRIAQRETSLITALGSPFQVGGALGASSAVIGKVGTDHTTPGTTDNVTASSIQASLVATPTVTASSAYASGNTLGGAQTLTGAVRSSGSTALLTKVVLNFKSAQTAPTDVLIFNQSPGSTTVTDKTAINLAVADFDKLVGVIHLTDCTGVGTPSVCQWTGALSVKAVGSANLVAVLVTRGTPTFTATTDVSANFIFIQD